MCNISQMLAYGLKASKGHSPADVKDASLYIPPLELCRMLCRFDSARAAMQVVPYNAAACDISVLQHFHASKLIAGSSCQVSHYACCRTLKQDCVS